MGPSGLRLRLKNGYFKQQSILLSNFQPLSLHKKLDNWKYWTPKCSHIVSGCLPGGKRVRKREPRCTSASCKHAAEADRSLLWNPRAKIQICQSSFKSEEKDKTESYLFGAAKTWLNFCIGRGRRRWHLFVRNGIVCIFVVRPPAIHLIWWNWIVRSIGKRGSLFWPA